MGGGASKENAKNDEKKPSPGEVGRRRMSIGTASNSSVGAEHDGGLQDAHFHSITVATGNEAKTEYSPRSDKRRYSISFSDQNDIAEENSKKQGILFGVVSWVGDLTRSCARVGGGERERDRDREIERYRESHTHTRTHTHTNTQRILHRCTVEALTVQLLVGPLTLLPPPCPRATD